jgi:O-antigen/teichoic acid export membrane protein
MGVIRRESIKSTSLSYIGVIVGSLSALLIYPLDSRAYGLAIFLYSSAFFLLPFSSFGITSAITKFFPHFKTKDSNHNNGFLFLVLSFGLIAYASFVIIFVLFKGAFFALLTKLGLGEVSLEENYILILLLLLAFLFMYVFMLFLNNYHKILVPQFFQNFLYKLFLPVAVLLHYLEYISESTFSILIVAFFAFVAFALIMYTVKLGYFNIKPSPKGFLTSSLKSEIRSYLTFSSLNVIGYALAFRIDMVMVAMMLGFSMNGTYGIIYTLALTIDIPNKSIIQIASPIISDSWQRKDIAEISNIYKKSSLNLISIGIYLFLMIWLCYDSLIELSTNTSALMEVKYVFFFLGLSKLVDMITGVNTQIIIFSKYYKANLIFILVLGMMNVIGNYILIGEFQVIGAAIATFASMCVYNIIKLLFIYIKIGLQPFSASILKILLIATTSCVLTFLFPSIVNPFANIILKSAIFSLLYLPTIYFLNVAPDITGLMTDIKNRATSFFQGKK